MADTERRLQDFPREVSRGKLGKRIIHQRQKETRYNHQQEKDLQDTNNEVEMSISNKYLYLNIWCFIRRWKTQHPNLN